MRYLAMLMVLLPCWAPAAVYKWVDEDGNIVYSDQPHPGAEEITDLEPPTIQAPRVPAFRPQAETEREPPGYETVAIAGPVDDATVRDNTGNVQVSVNLEPALRSRLGHRLQLLVDGQPFGEPGTSASFQLENVDRGTHTLQAQVVDREGKVLASSDTTRFHLHRATVQGTN